MSNPLAIAAATATLRAVIDAQLSGVDALSGTSVTTRPLEKARDAADVGNQINIFLYEIVPNAAWRNRFLPESMRGGEQGALPMALNLHYLITPYTDNDEILAHQLLAHAMLALHDHPVFGQKELRLALPGNDLDRQVERVRINPHYLSVEDLSKLWTTFQAGYRLSAAYEVSVILIESSQALLASLPVLNVGGDARGVTVAPDTTAPPGALPRIDEISIEAGESSAVLGDILRVSFTGPLNGTVELRFFRGQSSTPVILSEVAIVERSAGILRIQLPEPGAVEDTTSARHHWGAGPYELELRVRAPGQPAVTSNRGAFDLGPTITAINGTPKPGPEGPLVQVALEAAPPNSPDPTAKLARLRIGIVPDWLPGQRVGFFLGKHSAWLLGAPEGEPKSEIDFELTFSGDDPPLGPQVVRLRVDGVDTRFVDQGEAILKYRATERVILS